MNQSYRQSAAPCPFCDHRQTGDHQVFQGHDGSFVCKACGSHWRDINEAHISSSQHSTSTHEKDAFANIEFGEHFLGQDDFNSPFGKRKSRRSAAKTMPHILDERPMAQAQFGQEEPENISKSDYFQQFFNLERAFSAQLASIGAAAFICFLVAGFGVFYFSQSSSRSSSMAPDPIITSSIGSAAQAIKIDRLEFKRSSSGSNGGSIGGANGFVKVSGVLRNDTDRAQIVGPIRLILKSDSNKEVFSWVYRPSAISISANGTLRFSSAMVVGNAEFSDVNAQLMN